jgi:hypothetical protein
MVNIGLYDECESLYLYLVGAQDVIENCKSIYSTYSKIKFVTTTENSYEYVTLEFLQKFCGIRDSYIFYLHSKGVTQINPDFQPVVDWRNLLNYFNITNYKLLLNKIKTDEYNCAGVNLNTVHKHPHFSGNFWWTTSNYVKTIPKIQRSSDRYEYELNFISKGISWKPYCIYSSNVNHYADLHKKILYQL